MWGWYPTGFTGKSLRARDQEFPSYVLLPVWPLATFIGNKTKADWTNRISLLFKSLPIICIYLATWNLSDSPGFNTLNSILTTLRISIQMISLFLFLIFFFQTFNGNFDQNTVEKQILFSAFVARYLRFVVGSKHGGACLRVEISGIPRSRGLNIAEIVQSLRNIVFYPVVEPSFTSFKRSFFLLRQHQLFNHYLVLSF